jgi:hypothetical protein
MEAKMRGSQFAEDTRDIFAAYCPHATLHCPTRSLEEMVDRFFSDATRQVRAFLASPTLDAAARTAFGASVGGKAVVNVIRQFDAYGWPRLVVVDADVLGAAYGAYVASNDTIYLSRSFLESHANAASSIVAIILHEIGHAIDNRVQVAEAPGDEGAIFAALVRGEILTPARLKNLQSVNDHGVVIIDGHALAAEFVADISSIIASGTGINDGTGDMVAGDTVTLTVNFSEAVTVAGGTPTLTLDDGGVATYTGGSGTSALTFSYVVAAPQSSPSLNVTSFNLSTGVTVQDTTDAANADLTIGTTNNLTGTLQIDTTVSQPTPTSIVASGTVITDGTGDLAAGSTVTLTVGFDEALRVAGGTPTRTLDDGGVATYTEGSGTSALTFGYVVAAGQNIPDLAVSSFVPNGATVQNGAGTNANLMVVPPLTGSLQIDTTVPTPVAIVASGTGITDPITSELPAGSTVTLTVDFNEAVTVAGGTPTLALSDGGITTYTGGSGTGTLTFSYVVEAGDDTIDLAVSAFNLNGATIQDGAGTNANLTVMPALTGAQVSGSIAIDGNLSDWTPAERIDNPGNAIAGYELYGTVAADTYLIAIQAKRGTEFRPVLICDKDCGRTQRSSHVVFGQTAHRELRSPLKGGDGIDFGSPKLPAAQRVPRTLRCCITSRSSPYRRFSDPSKPGFWKYQITSGVRRTNAV